jgi:LmbE family N-acetylglucosaminyl deacetylase
MREREEALAEERRAAACLGYAVENLGYQAMDLKFEDRLVQEVLRRVDAVKATVLLCPWERDIHHDHEVVSRIAVAASRRIPTILMGQINYYLRDIFTPNVFVDITSTWE